MLTLAAAVNIPPPVMEIVRQVPRGKGMAGLAFEHDEPISTCNIKDDSTGRVRPGAKAVNAQAAVAFPVHDAQGAVRAVVGIAYAENRELKQSESTSCPRPVRCPSAGPESPVAGSLAPPGPTSSGAD